MALWKSPSKLLFKAEEPNLKEYIGRYVRIGGRKIKIRTLVGNIGMILGHANPRPIFYEINGEHLLSMLRFHCQMNNAEHEVTEEEHLAFESMHVESEKLPDKHPLDLGPYKDVKAEVKSDG